MRNWRARLDIEDLRRAVAASGNKPPIKAESHTANHTLVGQVVDQVHVKDTPRAWVEHCEPVRPLFLEVIWQLFDF